jgi:hypothetical protein
MLTRSVDVALAWRLAAEAADRFADEAFELSEAVARGDAPLRARTAEARSLARLVGDLLPIP